MPWRFWKLNMMIYLCLRLEMDSRTYCRWGWGWGWEAGNGFPDILQVGVGVGDE
jgi:hypothetical protein